MPTSANRRDTRFTLVPVRYAQSKVHGIGAFAAAPIRKGTLISTTAKAWFRRNAKDAPSKRWAKWLVHSYRDKGRTIFLRGPMKFVNHSCDPNINWDGDKCFAVRNIKKGEELVEDYSLFASPTLKIDCQCGAKACRGTVVGKRAEVPIEAIAENEQNGLGKHILCFLNENVVDAARHRILWCYESFDCPLVSFSGGKDSLALLLLTLEVCGPLGIKPHVIFMDEEFVPTRTLEFVKWVFYKSEFAPCLVPHWLCWQMDSEIYCAQEVESVVQWGKNRKEWLREPPEGALMDPDHIYDIFSPDAPLALLFPGKSILSMLGVRAGESLARLGTVRHSAGSKEHPCFVRRGMTPGVYRAVPLYDWLTYDVFRFLSERHIINPIYYEMLAAGKALRTDTPLHGRRCNIAAFKKIDPAFFDRLAYLFPQVHAAALYNEATKPVEELIDGYAKKYGKNWNGLYEYCQHELKPETGRVRAETVLQDAASKHERLRRRGLSGIPVLRVWKAIVSRQFDHSIAIDKWTDDDYAFENKENPNKRPEPKATSAA